MTYFPSSIPVIPAVYQPSFSVFPLGETAPMLGIGREIKDLPDHVETNMLKDHKEAVARAEARFDTAVEVYNAKHSQLLQRADAAVQEIDHAKWKKVAAITALVGTILGIVGVAVASAVTMTWPIALAVIPLAMAMVPSCYYTHIFRAKVQELKEDIAAPGRLPYPIKETHYYDKRKDLQLASSRERAIDSLATKSLAEIASSGWSEEEIINYRLLDRVVPLTEEKRPAFYGQAIRLIRECNRLFAQHAEAANTISRTYSDLTAQLGHWRARQREHLHNREWDNTNHLLSNHSRYDYRGRYPLDNLITTLDTFSTIASMHDTSCQRSQMQADSMALSQNIDNWHVQSKNAETQAYQLAMGILEAQYKSIQAA